MLQHIVLFKLPRELHDEERHELFDLVEAWLKIEDLRVIRFGPPMDSSMTHGYQYLLYLELADLGAMDRYLAHPAHVRLGAWMSDRSAEALVFTYNLDGTSVLNSERT